MAIMINSKRLLSTLVVALLFAATASLVARTTDEPVSAGTVIANRAEATYSDSEGTNFNAVSSTVSVTVLAVATLTVTPKETVASANVGPHERITRLFRICNTGNVTSSYAIIQTELNTPPTLVNLYFDNDASGTVTSGDTPVTLGATASQNVMPGSCLGVLAVIDTNDAPQDSLLRIGLTARANAANGNTQDSGTIINAVGRGALLSNPSNAALPPLKQVNGSAQAVVMRGVAFTYTVAFRNSGDVTARAVLVTDDLPAGVEYVSNSLRLDNNGLRNLTDAQDADEGFVRGQHIEVQLAAVAPDHIVRIMFDAQLSSNAPAAVGLINFAQLRGENVPLIGSSSAVVVGDPFGTVFAGRAGANSPIPGASVAIFSDQSFTNLLPLTADQGVTPNSQNVNPFASDGLGHFNFALSGMQLGTDAAPSRYFVRVQAGGFIPRLIELDLSAREAGLLSLTARALDAQPLAVGGGFTLVRQDVRVDNLTCLAFNIPMFEEHGLEITKSVDVQRAEIGDVVTYRVEIHNPTAATISDVTVHDRLPDSFHYVPGTARLTIGSAPERQLEPEVAANELLFRVGELGPGAGAHLLYRVRIGANAREGDVDNLATGSGVFPSGEQSVTATARATVRVGGGVFSARQMIVGRVFEDVNRNGIFDAGDKPVAGARLYLTSGQSVITDSQGLYNFPALGDGSQVVALDPVTLPAGYLLADGNTLAGRSWTRLLRTPVGGGALLRQNFALVASGNNSTLARSDRSNANEVGASPQSESKSDIASKTNNSASQAATAIQGDLTSPTLAGTYQFAATETIQPVAPGTVQILSPVANSVVMTPALELTARVALNWKVKLEVNGEQISEKNIGTSRLDQKNQVATFTFVSIGLRPGPNRARVIPVGPDGAAGRAEDLTVMGRGPAERLEIVPEKTAIQAGGRDSTVVKIRAIDKWDHPASDNQVAIETSLGQLARMEEKTTNDDGGIIVSGTLVPQTDLGQPQKMELPESHSQLVVPLVGGEARIKLIGPGDPGEARLHALAGQIEAESSVRILSETRPTILVGLAELSFGRGVPEIGLRGEQGSFRNRMSFFFSGRVWKQNTLTLAYDSQRPINRTTGHDRLFRTDPLDRAYPLFGDSSTRFEAAQSNSKLYVRFEHDRSYAMFGDLDADLNDLALGGYTRKLTGVKLHLENSSGDFVTVTGARPDTSFAREVFPAGSLGLLFLARGDILQGSETVTIEVRDRRNPEIILSREVLSRSIDYTLNATTGELLLLRNISTFDSALNLKQIVVTYEHRASGLTSSVYTARGRKNFAGLGLKLGFSAVVQRQEAAPSFMVGGIDGEKSLPHRGSLRFAWATSQGDISEGVNLSGFNSGESTHDGNAFTVELRQPLNYHEAAVHARFASASAGFLNPFGSTVTPGSRRGEVTFDFKPRRGAALRFGIIEESNHTANVDNQRFTFSVAGDQVVKERYRFHLGFDHRSFTDDLNARSTNSNLFTAGAQIQLTDKIDVAIKREQNLGEADPTYPNQTTFAANYKVNLWTKIFFTQRLASAPIVPIGDVSQTGFAAANSRRETALGVESRFGKYTSFVGRYQLENGSNGPDSFAVFGFQNRLPVTKAVSFELGIERGFHLAGAGKSFNSATFGFGWTPNENFKASAHYEFRDRGGNGQLISIGAAGRLAEGITVLSRFRWSHTAFAGRGGSAFDGLAAMAFRPVKSDRSGLLFSYNHRAITQEGLPGLTPTRDRVDTLATDGYYQATQRLEVYGRFALRFNANGQPTLPFVSTLTYLTQTRAQYRLTTRFDWAGEMRLLLQPSSRTQHSVYGTELGMWAIPDLRFGVGYNFTRVGEPAGVSNIPIRRGFYFTITSKLSSLFDLFGTSRAGLANGSEAQQDKQGEKK
jgi:uncharacterized repeat protein (TIGR01451 family)